VGSAESWNLTAIEEGLACISEDNSIHEVILSGGDPLVLSDSRINMLLERICSNKHVRRVRFDTKVLCALPQRITAELIQILRRFVPVYIVGHFSHSYEVAERTRTACDALVNAGIPLAAHTPLLKGVNDGVDALANLFELLVDCRVRPYYLIQFIPTRWSEHFRVRISDALEIVKALGGTCSGLATPTYIVYLPDAGGKVPVLPPYLKGRDETGWVFQNLEGRTITYPEPAGMEPGKAP
jgi:lysine 2,3-aminomutase